MTKQDFIAIKNNILKSIENRRLADTFKQLRAFSERQLTWELTDEIEQIEQSYRYMLDYAMRGVYDPSRANVYNDIVNKLLEIVDKLERNILTVNTPDLYFNNLRYFSRSSAESISTQLHKYNSLLNECWDLQFNLTPSSNTAIENRRKRESLEKDIFNRVWVQFPLNHNDYEAISSIFASERYYTHFKQFMISALLLGLLNYYDAKRLMLLIEAYEKGDNTTSSTACIAIVLALYKYQFRAIDSKLSAKLHLLADNKQWITDLKNAFFELVRTRDTERITKTMQDEVVAEMIKLKPEIDKRISDSRASNFESLDDLDINPEWQEMLEKSGIADKMKKLFEIQLEGGDVFMSTFAHLKSDIFFNEISNWFMPFHIDRSEVVSLSNNYSDIISIIETSPIFCDNDKYSFILSLKNIPPAQRDMMKNQLSVQMDGILEMQNASMNNPNKTRASIMNRYVQDLYRFFKLFNRKNEFNDPFCDKINLITVPILAQQFNDIDSLQPIAEFYFKHKYYDDALNIFKTIENNSYPDVQLFEKIGYCYERLNDYSNALKYYEQAELLNADSIWTLRHIAMCHRILGTPQKAIGYYNRIVEKETIESISTLLSIGNCYLESNEYEKAINYFFKVNYLDSNSNKADRQLAWALMMTGKFDKAKEIYERIITTDSPTVDDYLNIGHLSLAIADNSSALDYYKQCIRQGKISIDEFARKLHSDESALKRIGIDKDIIPLIIDAVSYTDTNR